MMKPPLQTLFVVVAVLFRLVASVPSNNDFVTFTLYDNGSSQNGVEMNLSSEQFQKYTTSSSGDDTPPGEAFAIDMSSHIDVSKYMAPKPVIATRAFREDGELITDFQQLRPTATGQNRRVYLVAEDLEFIWPFVELWHNQTVSPNVVPPISDDVGPIILESLSEVPRVFRVYNMATEEEANTIISTALNATGELAMKRSTVGSGEDNAKEGRKDSGRTSENAWDSDSPTAKIMISRSFQLTNIEEDGGKRDGLQVVRYKPTQGYNTHPDYFKPSNDIEFNFHPYEGGSNRFATVFMYLNEPEEGGNTVFPRAPGIVPSTPLPQLALDMFEPNSWERQVTEDCHTKLGVPPKLGTAALFYSITPDGRIDPSSHHAACPLIKGTKWGANIWIWNKQRYGEVRTGDPRKILMTNVCNEEVYISWEGRDSGMIPPGSSMTMSSFEHHRFQASFGSHKGERIAEFTAQSEPEEGQTWIIKPPRHRNLSTSTSSSSGHNAAAQQMSVKLHLSNEDNERVCISWQGQKIAVLTPGKKTSLNTFVNHIFAASLGSCDMEPFDKYEVGTDEVQSWDILRYNSAISGNTENEVCEEGRECSSGVQQEL